MSKVSRRLVIDACVARAAGGEGASHPTSKSARDVLLAVRDICHRMVVTHPILKEWRKHRSRFAQQWLQSMFAKKKVVHLGGLAADELDAPRTAIAAIDKDIHLLNAALAADGVVLSIDMALVEAFCSAADAVSRFGKVFWVDMRDIKAILPWLEKGAATAGRACPVRPIAEVAG